MTILFYDCFSGISGDMNLAALIDLGVDPELPRSGLSRLGLDHEFELRVSKEARKGISGTRFDVVLEEPDAHLHQAGHHRHGSSNSTRNHEGHRNLRDIESIISSSSLNEEVKKTSLSIFRKLAEAEARVHGQGIHEIHFHEVGATDSIVDIVGAAICFHLLRVDEVWASPVQLGGGFVQCRHGLIPVPAPATVEILHGIPTTRGATRQETTTPTGAAILAALVDRFTASPSMVTEKTGYGIGHRDTTIPNVLRVHLARPSEVSSEGDRRRPARLLQCNIDDMTPETLAAAMDLLMEKGAKDVHFTPVLMKKSRPATCLSLLCWPEEEEHFQNLLFRHTTTLGIKSFSVDKTVLETSFETWDTPYGPVTMKKAWQKGKLLRAKPELEDCREIARIQGISLSEVQATIAKMQP